MSEIVVCKNKDHPRFVIIFVSLGLLPEIRVPESNTNLHLNIILQFMYFNGFVPENYNDIIIVLL